jgi:hypothetical protein
VPTVSDPRGTDFRRYDRIKHPGWIVDLERRAADAMAKLGILLTDTCINYQSVLPPIRGEHLAFGDTGSVIYTNGALGARSNFEGGVAALWAALTGRTPRYGMHLEAERKARSIFALTFQPRELTEWGAVGGVVGRQLRSYWDIPIITGIDAVPGSDALKHLAAALGSYGATPLFHLAGVTPEAPDLQAVAADGARGPIPLERADVEAFHSGFARHGESLDLVVFAAPQLSLLELQALATPPLARSSTSTRPT